MILIIILTWIILAVLSCAMWIKLFDKLELSILVLSFMIAPLAFLLVFFHFSNEIIVYKRGSGF